MASSQPAASKSSSGNVTPNPAPSESRFTSQASTAEDLLKSQTVGLVHLSDFRKRRAQALEQKEREAADKTYGRLTTGSRSGSVEGASTPLKKKRRTAAKGKLSFAVEEDGDDRSVSSLPATSGQDTPVSEAASPALEDGEPVVRKRLGPNASIAVAPKAMTKSALLREAQDREQLRKEFLAMQEVVKATEILIPFVFYDGTNIPGGVCKVKKGDHAWIFLDKSRKVGAELGVGGAGGKRNSRRQWARVGVDDLMLVRGEIIIPHHYEFYYFIVNKTIGPSAKPLFPYSSQPASFTLSSRSAAGSPLPTDLSTHDPLSRPPKAAKGATMPEDVILEGANDDPTLTKVVDRRWYERNKHIFPASVWEEFDPAKDYSNGMRRDTKGNAFFFS